MESNTSLSIQETLQLLGDYKPEMTLAGGILLLLTVGLFNKKNNVLSLLTFLVIGVAGFLQLLKSHAPLSSEGLALNSGFSYSLALLIDAGGMLTTLFSWSYWRDSNTTRKFLSEYYALILAVILGSHLLSSTTNLVIIFIAMELISIPSYALAGFMFDKKSAEGSMKYFLFGSVASAVMLYGFSILYGFFGSIELSNLGGISPFIGGDGMRSLLLIGGFFSLTGFLYKIAAAPMHLWSPDVYQSSPMPVVAFFSVVPKLAGLGVLTTFVSYLKMLKPSDIDWELIISAIAMVTIFVGNFAALRQKNPKRLMAYSSIAQSGFLLIGIVAYPIALPSMTFYAAVYVVMNFLVFWYLQYFEKHGFTTIASYENASIKHLWPSVFLLVGLISLTGLPPTGGFSAKLFIFSALWEDYSLDGKSILKWLLLFGLLNTVVSLFYYLRIPYYAFIKNRLSPSKTNILGAATDFNEIENQRFWWGNLLGLILVIVLLLIFFVPGLLMGWINKINFVL